MSDIKVVTCPQVLPSDRKIAIFLAGGITGCPDWQQDFIKLCQASDFPKQFTLVNPRRKDFDVTNPDISKEQIMWEYNYLRICDKTIFWFPKETLCPITLFELGSALQRRKDILIGCHPDYARKFDVEYQVNLANPNIKVVDSVEALALQLMRS